MVKNGQYKMKEISYCSDRELEDMDYLPARENMDCIFDHLLQIASDNPHIEDENEFEDYHKGIYQDNYYFECYGNDYCVQHDIVTNDCTLYLLKSI